MIAQVKDSGSVAQVLAAIKELTNNPVSAVFDLYQ